MPLGCGAALAEEPGPAGTSESAGDPDFADLLDRYRRAIEAKDVIRYSQHWIDVINLRDNRFESVTLSDADRPVTPVYPRPVPAPGAPDRGPCTPANLPTPYLSSYPSLYPSSPCPSSRQCTSEGVPGHRWGMWAGALRTVLKWWCPVNRTCYAVGGGLDGSLSHR